MGSLFLLQQIFLNQESNQGLLHCRRILYQLSYHGSLAHGHLANVWWQNGGLAQYPEPSKHATNDGFSWFKKNKNLRQPHNLRGARRAGPQPAVVSLTMSLSHFSRNSHHWSRPVGSCGHWLLWPTSSLLRRWGGDRNELMLTRTRSKPTAMPESRVRISGGQFSAPSPCSATLSWTGTPRAFPQIPFSSDHHGQTSYKHEERLLEVKVCLMGSH